MFHKNKSVRSFYIEGIYELSGNWVKYNQENKRENKTAAKTKKNVNKKSGNTPNAARKMSTKNPETRQMQNRDGLVQNNKKEGNDETFICF